MWWRELTFANRVLPVPGGPYMRMFLYRPLFCLVFLVAMAISRTRSSKDGWHGQTQVIKMQLVYVQGTFSVFTHTEHDPLQGILRFALQPLARLNSFRWTKIVKLGYFAVENIRMDHTAGWLPWSDAWLPPPQWTLMFPAPTKASQAWPRCNALQPLLRFGLNRRPRLKGSNPQPGDGALKKKLVTAQGCWCD